LLHSHNDYADQHYPFFVTCSAVKWLPLFEMDPYRSIIVDSLAYIVAHKPVELNAYVIMPTHVHAILWSARDQRIGDILRDLKRFTSRAISRLAEERNDIQWLTVFREARQAGRAQVRSQYQVWQEGSHPEAIYSPAFARQKLEYIHNNPVKAGLASTAVEWAYSSAGAYLLGEEQALPVQLLPL
jgi:putative transposase